MLIRYPTNNEVFEFCMSKSVEILDQYGLDAGLYQIKIKSFIEYYEEYGSYDKQIKVADLHHTYTIQNGYTYAIKERMVFDGNWSERVKNNTMKALEYQIKRLLMPLMPLKPISKEIVQPQPGNRIIDIE